MDERAWLARYAALGLLVIGGLEWLLGRVVSRFAAIPPLEGTGRTIVEALGRTGIFFISTAFILAVTLYLATALRLGAIANRRRDAGSLALALYLTLFGVFLAAHAVFTLLALFSESEWLNVSFNILSMVAVWWLAIRFVAAKQRRAEWDAVGFAVPGWATLAYRLGVLLVPLAYTAWYYSVLYSWLAGPGGVAEQGGPADALRLGELAAVLTPFAFFVAIAVPGGEWRHAKRWIAPVMVLVLFAAGNVADIAANQGYTGVFAIWSVGFTLWLPWPLYGVSLALFLYALLTCASRAPATGYSSTSAGMGLLLLLFAGYYLQLTYQHLLAVLAVMLLTRIARPIARSFELFVDES